MQNGPDCEVEDDFEVDGFERKEGAGFFRAAEEVAEADVELVKRGAFFDAKSAFACCARSSLALRLSTISLSSS